VPRCGHRPAHGLWVIKVTTISRWTGAQASFRRQL
jgi:hypothetical protein